MGLNSTPWVPDMLDTTCSFGSMNLLWNQALADIQARVCMNVFNLCGFNFMAYPGSSSGLEFLLDPRYAWMQTFGKGNNGNIFDFSNFDSWNNGMDWFNKNDTPPSNDSGSSYDPNKAKCDDLIHLLDGFIKYLESTNDPAHREWVSKAKELKNKKTTKDYTYENKYNDLLKLCQDGINKDLLSNYLISEDSALNIGGVKLRDLLRNAGHPDVLAEKDEVKDIAEDYKKDLDKFSENDTNLDAFDNRLTTSNVLAIIGHYNSNNAESLMKELKSKYDTVYKEGHIDKDANNKVIKAMNHVAGVLKSKAESRKNLYNPATQTAINDLVKLLPIISENEQPTDAFVNAFDKLYETLRLAEISVIEKDFNSLYKDIGVVPLFEKNDSRSIQKKTQDDLAGEKLTARIGNSSSIGPAATITNNIVENQSPASEAGNDGQNTGGVTPPAPPALSQAEVDLVNAGKISELGTLADGKRLYQCLETVHGSNGGQLTKDEFYYFDNGKFNPITAEEICVRTNEVEPIPNLVIGDKQIYKPGSNAPAGLDADTYYTIEPDENGNLKYKPCLDENNSKKTLEQLCGDCLVEAQMLVAVSGLKYDGKLVFKGGSAAPKGILSGKYYYVSIVDGNYEDVEPCDTEKLFKENNCITAEEGTTFNGKQVYTVSSENTPEGLDPTKKYYFDENGNLVEYTGEDTEAVPEEVAE